MIEIRNRHTGEVIREVDADTLADAYLAGANLGRANLAGANLARANGIIDGGTPDGWTAFAWIRDGWVSIRGGCHEFRPAEARAYWSGKPNRREVMAAVDYMLAVAKIRGWKTEEPK